MQLVAQRRMPKTMISHRGPHLWLKLKKTLQRLLQQEIKKGLQNAYYKQESEGSSSHLQHLTLKERGSGSPEVKRKQCMRCGETDQSPGILFQIRSALLYRHWKRDNFYRSVQILLIWKLCLTITFSLVTRMFTTPNYHVHENFEHHTLITMRGTKNDLSTDYAIFIWDQIRTTNLTTLFIRQKVTIWKMKFLKSPTRLFDSR